MSRVDLRASNFDYDSSYHYYLCPENQVWIDWFMSYREYNINLQVWGTYPVLSFYIKSNNNKKGIWRHVWKDSLEFWEEIRRWKERK